MQKQMRVPTNPATIIRCNHCGLPVNALLEPLALTRDMALCICDLCASLSDAQLMALPELHPARLDQ